MCADSGPTETTSGLAVTAAEATTEDFSDVSPSLSPAPSWAGSHGAELALVPPTPQQQASRATVAASSKGKQKARHLFVQPGDTGSTDSAGTGATGEDVASDGASAANMKGPAPAWRSPTLSGLVPGSGQ